MSTDEPEPYLHENMTLEDMNMSPVSSPPVMMLPCTIEGIGPGLGASAVGYVIGAGVFLALLHAQLQWRLHTCTYGVAWCSRLSAHCPIVVV